MKILNLIQTYKNKTKSKITFKTNQELLMAGFKFCYVAPEKIEEGIISLCREHGLFTQSETDCLEENLMNHAHNLKIENEQQALNISWDQVYAGLKL